MSNELKYTPADLDEACKIAFEEGYHEGDKDFMASDELKYAQADLDKARKIAFDEGYKEGYDEGYFEGHTDCGLGVNDYGVRR
jgi:hypothetical protein